MSAQHLISIDLEDWYTSAYLRDYVKPTQITPQIEQSTEAILNLFAATGVKATFFVLGDIAKKHRALVKRIASDDHEIASHGYSHTPLWDLTPEMFHTEIVETNKVLEDITGKKVKGFRAPYCSLQQNTAWMLDILESEGFTYDSSIFPMRTILYGVNNAPLGKYGITSQNILQHNPDARLTEIPFTLFSKGGVKIPCTGGVYGRVLPYAILKALLQSVSGSRSINFYFHPWEAYNQTPVIEAPLFNRFISYYNTGAYLRRVEKLLGRFSFTSFEDYLAS
jgi:peptidoglycan-N-acetylglucosamine deacetylase